MNSSLNPEINKSPLSINAYDFFDKLKKNSLYESVNYTNGNFQLPKSYDTKADKDLIEYSKLINVGDQIYNKIPYEINNSRLLLDYNDGRNLNLLNSIKANSTNDRGIINARGQGGLGFII